MPHEITTLEELDAIYGEPVKAAQIKEIDYISDHYRAFIEASPFVILATCGAEGLDCSPRGDPKGFVRVVDRHTLMIPDRRGNNRIEIVVIRVLAALVEMNLEYGAPRFRGRQIDEEHLVEAALAQEFRRQLRHIVGGGHDEHIAAPVLQP